MTEPLQVGQFAIVDHEPVDRGPNAGVFHGRGPADDRVELFVVAEGTTPAGEAFAGHVVSALGQALQNLDMSLTGVLRRLFAEAERVVADWNRRSIAHHRVSLGMSCLARRGTQVVLAQAGPAAAVVVHGASADVVRPDGPFAQAIGTGGAGPVLRRLEFGAGDRVLLLSTPAFEAVDEELLLGISRLPAEDVLPDLYQRVRHLRHQTVLLVTAPADWRGERPRAESGREGDLADPVIDATGQAPQEQAGGLPMFQPRLFVDEEREHDVAAARRQLERIRPREGVVAAVPQMEEAVPAPLARAAGDSGLVLSRVAEERRARAQLAAAAPMLGSGGARVRGTDPGSAATQVTGPLRRNPRSESFTRKLGATESARPGPASSVSDLPLVSELAEERRARPAGEGPAAASVARESGLAAGGGSLVRVRTSMGGRWRGSGTLNRTRVAGHALPPAWMVILSGLVLLAVLVGVVTLPGMLQQDREGEYSTLLNGAAQKLAVAQVVTDPTERREALVQAQAMLLKAREIQEGDPQAETLFNQVAGALNEMDRVVEPAAVEVVATLDRLGDKPVAPTRMAVGPEHVYLLDANGQQVVEVDLVGGGARSVFGETKEANRGRPVAIAQLDANDRGVPALLVLDSGNRLWTWEGGALSALAFNAPAGLAVTDMAVRGRDLYVLDADHRAVYRWQQEPDGFPNPPLKVVDSAELANARRLFVDTDVLTVDADGTVRRFLAGGGVLRLAQAGIDRKLVAAETPQAISDSEIAILDPAISRVVVLLRDGAFARQYRHPDFDGARAFAVRGEVAYLFSGSTLRRITW
ncbi:hypothetical protein [Tepidiforma sp.]|uniref:hypothetical protein n=1 Tax=Tepidiforma sp. TaxID=2682230 RepID=UPI002ADD636D|nr:hypothetical protein [Tepidiforma sp.]